MKTLINSAVAAVMIAFLSGNALAEDSMRTRFGLLSTDRDARLFLNGHIYRPIVAGNSTLTFEKYYKFDKYDLVVLVSGGGTACPETLKVMYLSAQRSFVTNDFGTCVEGWSSSRTPWGLVIDMPDTRGRMWSYRIRNGRVTKVRI